eukprot:jgi/Astpho2/8125/Aster-x1482
MLLAAGTLPLVRWCALPAATQAQAAAATATLDSKIASAYTRAIYTAVQDLQAASEEEFQRFNFKLRRREFPYYAEQHRSQLPLIPDLSDMSGGLSNPVLFNFVAYCTWKTAGTFVTSPEGRTRLSRLAGQHLAEELVPEALAAARQRNPGSITATGHQLNAALTQALQRLASGGYSKGFQICWGSFPSLPDKQGRNTWQTPQELCQPPPEGSPAGNILQIKLQRPADIAGSVALRSEEDGFSGRPAASMLEAVFAAAGFPDSVLADEYFFQGPAQAGAAATSEGCSKQAWLDEDFAQ